MNSHDESKIHLVSSNRAESRGRATRIEFGDLIADILQDDSHGGHIYQWIVQRRGSNDVLGIGQCHGFESAKAQATSIMSHLLRSQQVSQSGD